MASDTTFFEELIHRIKIDMHTIAPARIVSFDDVKLTADVELLFLSVDKDGDEQKYPLIKDAPVLGMRYKAKKSYAAQIDGLMGVHGSVDGSNAIIQPIGEIEYIPHLKKGDIVFVGFAERSLDNLNGAKSFNPTISRTHHIQDAVVLGVLF